MGGSFLLLVGRGSIGSYCRAVRLRRRRDALGADLAGDRRRGSRPRTCAAPTWGRQRYGGRSGSRSARSRVPRGSQRRAVQRRAGRVGASAPTSRRGLVAGAPAEGRAALGRRTGRAPPSLASEDRLGAVAGPTAPGVPGLGAGAPQCRGAHRRRDARARPRGRTSSPRRCARLRATTTCTSSTATRSGPTRALGSSPRGSGAVARGRDPGGRPAAGSRSNDLVIYELHVGTFTDEGTFDGVDRAPRRAARARRDRDRADAGRDLPGRPRLGLRRRLPRTRRTRPTAGRRASRGWSTPRTARGSA